MTASSLADDGATRNLTAAGQDRKAAIVAAAEQLFAEQGYDKTRMTDIAEATGVTKGLLYWYFESKQDLIAEILLRTRQELRDERRLALDSIADPLERLYVNTYISAKFILAHYRLYVFGGEGQRRLATVLRESSQVHAEDMANTIADGQTKGVVRDNDKPVTMAFANFGVVTNLCGAAYYRIIDSDPDTVARSAATYVVRACATKPSLANKIEKKFATGIPA